MYQQLKAAVAAIIKENNNNEISGLDLQGVLNNLLIPELGAANYLGIATPTLDPGTPERPVYYLASATGVYDFFPSGATTDIELTNECAILRYVEPYWVKDTFLDIDTQLSGASKQYVDDQDAALEQELRALIASGGNTQANKINYFAAGYAGGLQYKPYGDWDFNGSNFVTGGDLTLDPADPNLDRIDLLVCKSDGTIAKKTGTPALNPVEPTVDPATELKAALILIQAGATTPSGVNLTTIYNENSGSDWSGQTVNGGTYSRTDASDPYEGTVALKANAVPNYSSYQFNAPAPVQLANITEVSFRIKNIDAFPISRLNVQVLGAAKNGRVTTLSPQIQGYDPNNTSAYQKVFFSTSGFSISDISAIRIGHLQQTFGGQPDPSTFSFLVDKVQYTNDNAAVGGDGYATLGYVDRRDQEILQAAKDYTDTKTADKETVAVASSRALSADDHKRKLLITANITLTWPSPGIAGFEVNFDVDAAGQLLIADQAATPGNDLDAASGTILEAGKMGHAYARPDNGKLRLKGDWIV